MTKGCREWVLAPCQCAEKSEEGIIGRPGKATLTKRDRERNQQLKRRDKEARQAQRKANKPAKPESINGEDPDLEGMRWGPQAPLF